MDTILSHDLSPPTPHEIYEPCSLADGEVVPTPVDAGLLRGCSHMIRLETGERHTRFPIANQRARLVTSMWTCNVRYHLVYAESPRKFSSVV